MSIFADLRKRFLAAGRDDHELPGGVTQHGRVDDSADMLAASEADPEPLLDGLSVGITYEDADGNISERLVNCIKIVENESERYLWGYCHLRTDFRAFQLDRIREIRDYRTGAHTDDAERFFAPFRTLAEQDQAAKTEFASRATREVLGLVGDELRILMFVAMADRHFDAREQELISEFIQTRARQLGDEIFQAYDHARVLEWMRGQVPSFSVLERAVQRLSARGEWELRALWDLSKDIVHADDHVDDKEVTAMEELYNAIDAAVSQQREEAG